MIDLLYLAYNRLAFTRETFATLLANTDWNLVRELVVWDDGSTDGTREWLRGQLPRVPARARLVESRHRSPVTVFRRFVEQATAPLLAKIDNDAMMPPGWLAASAAVLEAHPELQFLGIEAIAGDPSTSLGMTRSYLPAPHISGLGLYRRSAFNGDYPTASNRWFGFEQWQTQHAIRAGWLDPALPVFLLDRLPFEPWVSLNADYVRRDWTRAWDRYPITSSLWHWRWPEISGDPVPFDIVIPSANAANVIATVRAILQHEPALDPSHILIVDDGARAGAESALPGVRWIDGIKPFVFSRNVNLGISASTRDVILLNDDALLTTPGGFSALSTIAREHPEHGLLSAVVKGTVGNRNQLARGGRALRTDPRILCFICTYIPRRTIENVGLLDERFVGYGFEDDDYCGRVLAAGRSLAIAEACVVDHGKLPSSFRTQTNHAERFAQNRRIYEEKLALSSETTIVAALRVKNEALYIGEVLESVLPLCRGVLLFDDHSTDATRDIARSFGERVTVVESPFAGLDESRDKNHMLPLLAAMNPHWVLWIDGDEVLERGGPLELRRLVEQTDASVAAYSLIIKYIWDRVDQVRIDGIWGRFRRPSLFRMRGQHLAQIRFPSTQGVNLHCGNVPRGLTGATRDCNVRIKHYGMLSPEIRQRKYEWYTRIDPNNAAEDNYRHIISAPGARYAPGPPRFERWVDG